MQMSNNLIIGVSVGVGEINAVLCDKNFVILERKSNPLQAKLGKESIVARIQKTVTSLPSFHKAWAIGVSLPAVLDKDGKKIIKSTIEELDGANVYQLLSRKLNLPVFLFRRNFCSLLAEQAFGEMGQAKNAVFVEIGRDTSLSFLIGGKIYRGSTNSAGQISKIIVDITREKRQGVGEFGALISGVGIEALTGKSVYQVLKENPKSELVNQQILRDLKESLLTGLYNVKLLFDPELFVISGDIVENFALFKTAFADLGVRVVKSSLGKDGPAQGGAIAAYNQARKKTSL